MLFFQKELSSLRKQNFFIMATIIRTKQHKPSIPHYTVDEINAMIDESERQIAMGLTISDDDSFRKYDEMFKKLEDIEELQLEAV